eukprot:EG_transcript_8959
MSPGDVTPTQLHCVNASDPREGQCFFRNAYIVDNVIWVVRNESLPLPKLLCSAFDQPAQMARYCDVEWHPPADLVARFTQFPPAKLQSYDSGIAFSRLNPSNMYHSVMEDHMPLFELIHTTPELSEWLGPPNTSSTSHLLHFLDGCDTCQPGAHLVRLLYPAARLLWRRNPTTVFHVKLLVAGSKTSCAHPGHCRRGHFRTPDIGTHFRRFALRRAGLAAEPPPQPGAPARVTVVQRKGSRRTANLAEMVAAVNGVLSAHYGPAAQNATVVDFARLSLRDQMLAMLHTDILVMVHGGVYGATVFLPRRAIVIDIYPYAFYPEQHGYHLNGIHLSMPSMHYGQLLLETNDTSSTVLVGVRCFGGPCSGINTTIPLHKALCVLVDAPRLAERVRRALLAWGAVANGTQPTPEAARAVAAVYAPPAPLAAFLARGAKFTEVGRAALATLPWCGAHHPCDPSVLQRFLDGGHCTLPSSFLRRLLGR